MDLRIEPATEADAEPLIPIQVAAFHDDARLHGQEDGGPPGYDDVESLKRDIREATAFRVMDGERHIGGVIVFTTTPEHHHLDLIFLDPATHNQGVGARVMAFLEESFPTVTRWTLDTPAWATRNHHFYEKCGYVHVGEYVPEDDDILLWKYEKQIPQNL